MARQRRAADEGAPVEYDELHGSPEMDVAVISGATFVHKAVTYYNVNRIAMSAKLALEVYARKMKRDRETGKRMDALVDWALTGTNGKGTHLSVVGSDTLEAEEAA